MYLREAVEEVGGPDGLVNVVTGRGSVVGDVFLEHDAVEAISFTGSTGVGEYLAANSGMKEITLELGGNDPTIIWGDTDIDAAAAQVIQGACSNAGQVCNSVERVTVSEHIEAEVVDSLVDQAESLVVGDPFEEDTDVAAMVDDERTRQSSNSSRGPWTRTPSSRPTAITVTASSNRRGCRG